MSNGKYLDGFVPDCMQARVCTTETIGTYTVAEPFRGDVASKRVQWHHSRNKKCRTPPEEATLLVVQWKGQDNVRHDIMHMSGVAKCHTYFEIARILKTVRTSGLVQMQVGR